MPDRSTYHWDEWPRFSQRFAREGRTRPRLRLGKPPAGYGHWTLQLLADQLVALEVVDSISHETVRKTLKKTE